MLWEWVGRIRAHPYRDKTGKVFAQFKEKDNEKKQSLVYLRFTFYLYKKNKTSSCRNNVN